MFPILLIDRSGVFVELRFFSVDYASEFLGLEKKLHILGPE